jgi:hypothetical protein
VFEADKREFAAILQGTMETYNRPISPAALGIWWNALVSYDLSAVQAAFHRHITDPDQGRFPPTPAAIIGQMPDSVAVMSADEAWGLVIESMDERNTVVLTDLMMEASLGCGEVWEYDKVGARMMFKAAYERLATMARMTGRKPQWQVSLGWDKDGRAPAIQRAVAAGRLTHEAAKQFLPAPAMTADGQALAGLLTGKVVNLPLSDDIKARLAEVRAILAGGARPADAPTHAQERQETIEARQREAMEYLKSRHATH